MKTEKKIKARLFGSNIGNTLLVYRENVVNQTGTICGVQMNGEDNFYVQYKPYGDGVLSLAEMEYCSLVELPK